MGGSIYHYMAVYTIIRQYIIPLYGSILYHYTAVYTIIRQYIPLYGSTYHYTAVHTIIIWQYIPLYGSIYHYTALLTIRFYRRLRVRHTISCAGTVHSVRDGHRDGRVAELKTHRPLLELLSLCSTHPLFLH